MEYLGRILKYLKNYKLQIALILFVQFLYAIFSIFTLTLLVPFLQVLFGQVEPVTTQPAFSFSPKYVIDTFYWLMGTVIERHGQGSALLFIAGTMILLSFLSNACRYAGMYWLSHIRSGILFNIRDDFYRKLLRLPLSFYTEQRSGDMISRIGADVLEIEWSIISSLLALCRDPFLMIAYLITLFTISVKLSIVTLLIIPAMGVILSIIGKNIRNYSLKSQELIGRMTAYFEEAVDGLRVIKGYNAQDYVSEQFRKENFQFYRLNKKIFRIKELGSPLIEFLCIFTALVISLIGLVAFPESFAANGSLFMLYFVVFARMIPPAKSLATTYYQMRKGLSAAARIYEVIDADEQIKDMENPTHITDFQDTIQFKDVSFSYKNDISDAEACEVLKHVSFTLKKGETMAIVGPSGSGKSTLVDLLSRFYDVRFGQITIDGISLNQYALSDLRGLFGIVNQDVFLFDDTVYNNLTIGVESATEEQVIAAAKIAQAHQFIMELEEGYQTPIGNRGMRLSGGQRQRISIARAILKNPQIFILDEATSALDNESELLFQEALLPYIKQHTGIIIAHRLSTIRFADKILFLKEGQISEMGTHKELMEKQGEYYRFCNAQKMAE
ncbi:MAG: ABC transporter ATP-binding protein [Bacteroidales bacterium]|jgi:subfamily B ATP-binding cassette protein MsbA|nr:ABC transporter ATP-binding protein [Bacteroidales bacterium]